MAKKIRLIDDPETDEGIDDLSEGALTINEKQKLMKTIEALDWKLWEIYQIAQGFAKHFAIDLEKK